MSGSFYQLIEWLKAYAGVRRDGSRFDWEVQLGGMENEIGIGLH